MNLYLKLAAYFLITCIGSLTCCALRYERKLLQISDKK